MLVITLALAAIVIAAAVGVRRKRSSRSVVLGPRVDPGPAGLRHLAAGVSDLSDRRLHLAPARRGGSGSRPRLGVLLGLR